MKFVQKDMGDTSDASSARHTAFPELVKLSILAIIVVTAIFIIVGFTTDFFVSRISFQTEEKMFSSFNPPGNVDNSEDVKKVQAIFDKIKSNTEVPPFNYKIIVLENKMPNAFAFPGGTIGVTSGLLEKLKNEDESAIAFVLGHELGHFRNRDHLKGLGKSIGLIACLAIIFNKADVSLITNTTSLVMTRKYSRQREEMADLFGVDLVLYGYGNSENMSRFFEIISESDNNPDWAYMLATHPAPEKRVEKIKAYAEKKMHQN